MTPMVSTAMTTMRDTRVWSSMPANDATILAPTNASMIASECLRNRRWAMASEITKNIERSPRIAAMLLVYTTNVRDEMPSTAGTESIANTTSLSSTHASTINRGVPSTAPFSATKNRLPWNLSDTGIIRRTSCTIRFFSMLFSSSSSSPSTSSLYDDHSNTIANTTLTHLNRATSTDPSTIIAPRNTHAPTIPQYRTVSCESRGTRKYEKISRNTNKLSTESDCSTM
mmetsp:Transcript_7389/g.15779  ORF Transcript_7389/g.15779 Transcript_7389/m.15779 type:complete len:228 (-) Transcript_7389:390-1073(-)